ncbi:DUF1571 domain-containing protein [Reichenbachiella carrageenanivorans]|uniref:DUF1571 domain-containing protein n=1 Tax=Reichenbachiella carrageenanivorans TaxID=2979869 RepID=A0ABY6D2R8_9BACT|nr:DUF1571 domain-containing protein [Reichenbachiella carrageenanivorans]UXX80447.1 DUF1571 domain-containing protein [Reichenbachiella carrageenanivorans]
MSFTDPSKTSAPDKVKQVFEATRQIESLKYELIRSERINGTFVENHLSIKMHRRPYKIYMKELMPNTGMEVLYPHPLDEKKALVNPNGFPWVNLKLDPKGELMKKDQHHTILEGGYDYVVSVMEYLFYKHKDGIDDLLNDHGTSQLNGQTCEIISMVNPNFGYHSHTVKKGESISSIALKNRLSEYMILEKNPSLGPFSQIEAGDILNLPTDYAAKMVLFIDQDRQIPLKLEVYDELGLFEKYEFRNVEIDPVLTDDEFSDGYTAYSF